MWQVKLILENLDDDQNGAMYVVASGGISLDDSFRPPTLVLRDKIREGAERLIECMSDDMRIK